MLKFHFPGSSEGNSCILLKKNAYLIMDLKTLMVVSIRVQMNLNASKKLLNSIQPKVFVQFLWNEMSLISGLHMPVAAIELGLVLCHAINFLTFLEGNKDQLV